jgi:hypothetical protein
MFVLGASMDRAAVLHKNALRELVRDAWANERRMRPP